jgi:hypothetical protein
VPAERSGEFLLSERAAAEIFEARQYAKVGARQSRRRFDRALDCGQANRANPLERMPYVGLFLGQGAFVDGGQALAPSAG